MTRPNIDPEIRAFTDKVAAAYAEHPPIADLPVAEARRVVEAVRAPWAKGGPEMARIATLMVPTRSGQMRVRFYHPEVGAPAPALIYLHGGGFTLFSIDTHDRVMREYAARGGFVVVGADYPLSPEAKYPAALNAIEDLALWLVAHGPAYGMDPERIAIGGDSAGANLSVATALRLRDAGHGNRLHAMLLNYGGFGAECSDAAEARHGGEGAILSRAEVEYFWSNYVSGPADRADPFACPILADLEGLPPAFLVIAECDVLAEQSAAMGGALFAAGVEVRAKTYPGATHSFIEAVAVAKVAAEAIEDGALWVRERLG
ncbi:acetylesterase [Sphingomonas sp. DBB INV C78]|uniref:alpha/beta hydrolase fold domain-containing protein n=1 Tax=Sphingomonas sp. DBB INV C78 TaxID=3349434 RepID=UPI0036D31169